MNTLSLTLQTRRFYTWLLKGMLCFIACSAALTEANALTEDELIDGYSHAYNAKGRLSKGDFRLLARFELLQAEWNSTLVPLVRGLRDPNLDPEQWARTARRTLDEMTEIKVKMSVAAAEIEDTNARTLVKDIASINNQILSTWEDVRLAVMNGDDAGYRRSGMRAQQLAQSKAEIAGPIIRRLREKFGSSVVDGAIERALQEMLRKAGLR